MTVSLMCVFLEHLAGYAIVLQHVIRTVIGTKMIFLCGLRMAYGNLVKRGVAGNFRGEEKQFEIDHVIDDHRVAPPVLAVIPRTNNPRGRPESRAQWCCGLYQN